MDKKSNDNKCSKKKIRELYKTGIRYFLLDMRDIDNLALLSHITQELWMKEKKNRSQKKKSAACEEKEPGG